MRQKILAANWKMNKSVADVQPYFDTFQKLAPKPSKQLDYVFALPYLFFDKANQILKNMSYKLAAQNLHWEASGAFTGEVSIPMLQDAQVTTTLVGHSERRQYFNETNDMVSKKIKACEKADFRTILCVGETIEIRNANKTGQIIEEQVATALKKVSSTFVKKNLVIAYEPVWAIGTGVNATPEQAQEAHQYIRFLMQNLYGEDIAASLPILYGGSLKPSNAKDLLTQTDIDGGLVGGASLLAEDFASLAKTLLETCDDK